MDVRVASGKWEEHTKCKEQKYNRMRIPENEERSTFNVKAKYGKSKYVLTVSCGLVNSVLVMAFRILVQGSEGSKSLKIEIFPCNFLSPTKLLLKTTG